MNGNTKESQAHDCSPSSSTTKESMIACNLPSLSSSNTPETHTVQPPQSAPPPSLSSSSSSSTPPCDDSVVEKWGTHVMGPPAVPTCHPNNQKAALWGAGDQQQYHHHPYVQYTPIERTSSNPVESVVHVFNSWTSKAETTANNIWQNLKTGPSVSGAAWGKVNLTAKAITGGGFESLYKQAFTTIPNEKLKKTFACYLSTSTGPVAGTLYLSNAHIAFCSDRPLSFTAPSGQETWSYYKVMVPLGGIGTTNPVIMRDPSEKYIQIVTIDGHDFWFMGFVNFEKATRHISETVSSFVAYGIAVQPPVVA